MKKTPPNNRTQTLVLGIGNPFRGDDGVGLWVAEKFKGLNLPDVTVLKNGGDGTKWMDAWKDYTNVFVFDAVFSRDEPGTTYRIVVGRDEIPKNHFRCSTHSIGLPEAVELSRVLNRLPPYLVIFGINGKTFQPGRGLSAEVDRSARALLRRGVEEIHARNGAGR